MEEVDYLVEYGNKSLHTQSHRESFMAALSLKATHSPFLLAYPNATIYQLDESGINKVKYEDTEHYMVTKYFLNNHHEMMKVILDNK